MVRRSWPIEAVVGAELMRRGGGFTWRGRSFRIVLESSTTLLQISLKGGHNFRHDRPRSRHDRATIGRRSCSRCSRKCGLTIVNQFHNECCAIAARSQFDRTAIVEFFHDMFAPSDGDPPIVMAPRASKRSRTIAAVRLSFSRIDGPISIVWFPL